MRQVRSHRSTTLPNERWVRVRNLLAGIDERDLALAMGRDHTSPYLALPQPRQQYLGREVVGEVVEVGLDVSLVGLGDRVVLRNPVSSTCDALSLQPPCRNCASGNDALCEHRALPWMGVGAGWSSEMIVHEGQLFQPPEDLLAEQAVLLEPAARAIRAMLRCPLEPGSRVLLIGGGIFAQLIVAAARELMTGVTFMVATDLPHEIAALRALEGATIVPRRPRELLRRISELTSATLFERGTRPYLMGGCELVFDCEGSASSLEVALMATHAGGSVVLVLGYPQSQRLETTRLWYDEVTVVGIGNPGPEHVPEHMERSIGTHASNYMLAARLLHKGQLRTDTIITHRLPAAQLRRALAIASHPARHHVTRVVLVHE